MLYFYYLFAFITLFQVFLYWMCIVCGIPGEASGKEPTCQCKRLKRAGSLSWEASLVEGMATHSSILAWRVVWTEVWRVMVYRVTQSQT